MNDYYKELDNILKHLPETVKKQLHFYNPAVNSYIHHLMEVAPEDYIKIIDHMFVYYTDVISNYQNQLQEYLNYGVKPEDLPKLVSAYLEKIETKKE